MKAFPKNILDGFDGYVDGREIDISNTISKNLVADLVQSGLDEILKCFDFYLQVSKKIASFDRVS